MSGISALTVFFGAGIGGVLRWVVGVLATKWFGYAFPWGTLIVNVSGSTVMGILAGFLLSRHDTELWQTARLFLLTGVLGGYTTFSSFSLEAVVLWDNGEIWTSIGYVLASVLLAFIGLVVGYVAVRSF